MILFIIALHSATPFYSSTSALYLFERATHTPFSASRSAIGVIAFLRN
jgi:hypothetical protein